MRSQIEYSDYNQSPVHLGSIAICACGSDRKPGVFVEDGLSDHSLPSHRYCITNGSSISFYFAGNSSAVSGRAFNLTHVL